MTRPPWAETRNNCVLSRLGHTSSSGLFAGSPPREQPALLFGTESIDRGHGGLRDSLAVLRRFQQELLVTVDDDARLQQQRRNAGVPEHDQVVVAVDAAFGVEQLAA